MTSEEKQKIALMRYSAIAPAVAGLDSEYPSLGAFYSKAAEKGYLHPDGEIKHFSQATIERWYYLYNKGGFDALLPGGRSDEGQSRNLSDDARSEIRYLKQTYPRMSAASIYRKLITDGIVTKHEVSESTVLRFINRIKAEEQFTDNTDRRRYERPHINEVWCGDTCYGPYIMAPDGKKHRVYIIAIIDDASRMIMAADVFFNDNYLNLMTVIRTAVLKYGIPVMFSFDNGSTYRNHQMELLGARLGSTVHYCHPYSPTEKSKIERWFGTMKTQWMACTDFSCFRSLNELRSSLMSYVVQYNNAVHSSLSGKSPQERFFEESSLIRRIDDDNAEKCFLLEAERRVSADNVIVIDNTEYEVDYRFSKQRITLRYSPDMEKIYVVEADGKTLTPVRLLNKQENAFVKREKVRFTGGEA